MIFCFGVCRVSPVVSDFIDGTKQDDDSVLIVLSIKNLNARRNLNFKVSTHTLIQTHSRVRLACLAGLVALVPFISADCAVAQTAHDHAAPAKLVRLVRESTRQFLDVNAATAAGYGPFLGCVSGPDHGAMGIHYVNLGLYADGEIDVSHPEALIYEPTGDRRRLVGVEYLVDAATWLAGHNNTPPVLEGQVFQFVASPNRTTCQHSSNCTSGLGEIIRQVRSWIGTTVSAANGNRSFADCAAIERCY